MNIRNTTQTYGCIARFLHWTIAIAMIVMLVIGFSLGGLKKEAGMGWMTLHKSLGLTILLFMIIRLIWRLTNPTPRLPRDMNDLLKAVAHSVHWLLYICIIGTIIVGWSMSASGGHSTQFWGLFNATLPLPLNKGLEKTLAYVHYVLGWSIVSLLGLHVLGVLKHHILDRDFILLRMLGGDPSDDRPLR